MNNIVSLSDEKFKKKNFCMIDIFKFIFAISIVFVHYPITYITSNKTLNLIFICFSRLAVPFFFIASGYFLFKKLKYQENTEKKKSFQKYLKRLLKMYFIWSLINIPLVIEYYKNSYLEGNTYSYILRRILLVGTYRQFWYLLALIFDVIIIYYLNKKMSSEKILILSILLFLFGTIGFEFYNFVINKPIICNIYNCIYNFFITPRNFLFFGFCFVAIGNFFANYKFNISMKKILIIFFISIATLVIENIFFTKMSFKNNYDMRISLLPLSFSLFYILAHIEIKDRKIYWFLRQMSIYIYCMHSICAEAFRLLFKIKLTINQQFLSGLLLSIIFSFIIVKIKNTKISKNIY